MKGIYDFKVQPQDVDFQKQLTFSALGTYLLTTAGLNAESNGFGLRKLQSINSSWVLSKLAIEMKEKLTEFQPFRVETWVEEVGRLTTTRNFNILNSENEVIGSACSNWVMFDMKTRRAIDLLELKGLKEVATADAGLIDKPIRLGAVGGKSVADFSVKYSDIDINGHVYSMRYVQWLNDLFPLDFYRTKSIKRLEINYVNETLWGNQIQIFQEEKKQDDFYFEIKSAEKTVCKARMVWKTSV